MRTIIALILSVMTAGNAHALNEYVVKENYGGLVYHFTQAAELLEEFQTKVIFKDICFSSCTMYLSTAYTFPKCMEKGTVFGFHQPRYTGKMTPDIEVFMRDLTETMWAEYPEPIKAFLTLHGWPKGNKVTIMLDKDMEGVLPYC